MCWSINRFKNGCQPTKKKFVKAEKDNLFSDSHYILSDCKNYFPQLLNVHIVNNVMQHEIHTLEQLVLELIACEVMMVI